MDGIVKAGYMAIIFAITIFLGLVTGFDMMSFFLQVIKL